MIRPNIFLIAFLVLVGCKEEEILPPKAITLTSEVTDASGFNAQDGAIGISISGDEGPFKFFWSNGAVTEDISGLFAGEYKLRITFGNEGFHEETFAVEQPDPDPLVVDFDVTNASRFGKQDGAISINISKGIEPYTAIWEGFDTTFQYSNLSAGTYKVLYMDNSTPTRIIDSAFVSVTEPDFICGADSIADVDGNLYPTILIGNQCWIAENLRTEHLPSDASALIEGRFCEGSNCFNEKGGHYTWEATMNGEAGTTTENPEALVQGVCPDGWAIPTQQMFKDLDAELSLDGNYGSGFFSGAKMKGEESSSGFDALLAGNWGYGVYTNDDIAAFWTSTEFLTGDGDVESDAYFFYLTDDTPFLNSGHKPKDFGLNVRCIKIQTD